MSRPKYTYNLPTLISSQIEVQSVTLVELTSSEEMMAAKRAQNDPIRLAWELPKESLRAIDGKAISTADGSSDQAWESLHPKARSFVMQAYNQLHNPVEPDVAAFLQSRQVEIG